MKPRILGLPLFLLFSATAFADSVNMYRATYSGVTGVEKSSPSLACADLKGRSGLFPNYTPNGATNDTPGSTFGTCIWKTSGGQLYYYGSWELTRVVECPVGQVAEGNECVEPENHCAALADQNTGWKKEWSSFGEFDSDPGKPKCTTSQNGCAVDICGDIGSMTCAQSGQTGAYACFGNGTYTGQQQDESTGGQVDGCSGSECTPPPPTTSESSQDCTTPSTVEGVTTYTCVSSSNANQWASSNCSVGTVNGVQGLHCTSPDYVPEYDEKTRTDEVSEQSNPDGGKTTTTNTTNNRTQCKAGSCTSSSSSSTTTTTTDANGNVTGETSTCQGDDCGDDGKPSEEEDKEEESPMPSGDLDGPQITDALPAIGEDGDQSISEATASYYDRISNAPIVAAFTSLAVPTGGSCHIGSASLFGGSVSFNHFCEIAPEVLGGLRYLFLAIWAWAAIRLFGTA